MSTRNAPTKAPAGVRAPRQQRGWSSWERVLAAGTELLTEHGYEGFTLGEVGRRAGLSNGALYWRIESKEALFAAIHSREIDALLSEREVLADSARWQAADLDQLLADAIGELANSFTRRLDLMRVFVVRSMVDQTTLERGAEASERTRVLFESLLLTKRNEICHADPEKAVSVAFRMVHSVMTQRICMLAASHVEHQTDWDQLVDELAVIAHAYLRHGKIESG